MPVLPSVWSPLRIVSRHAGPAILRSLDVIIPVTVQIDLLKLCKGDVSINDQIASLQRERGGGSAIRGNEHLALSAALHVSHLHGGPPILVLCLTKLPTACGQD